jgi:small subunit ribosomal protein S6
MQYELMLILKPLLPEDLKAKVLKKVEDFIEKNKGKISGKDVWGKRHLAYPIKKHDEGYYLIYKLELASEHAEEFQNQLKLTNDVLRFVLIKESEL